MTDVEFNPEATDGDNDGIIQEGTPFERPIEEAELNPVEDVVEELPAAPVVDIVVEDVVLAEETVEDAVIASPSKKGTVKKKPALAPVEGGVMGSSSVTVEVPEPVAPTTSSVSGDKVAVFSTKNVYWTGVGRVVAGYNIVSKEQADQWLTRKHIRLADPSEVEGL